MSLRTFACSSLLLLVASCSLPDVPKLGGKDGGPDVGDPNGDGEDAGDEGPSDDDAGGAVGSGNKARVLSVAPTYALAEETYKYHPKSNVSEQTVWKVEQGPAGVTVEDDGATIVWTPTGEQKGKHELVLSAKAGGHELSQGGEITVAVADERAGEDIDQSAGGSVIVTAPKSRLAGASVYARPASLKQATRLTISEVDEAPAMGIAKDNTRAVKFGPSGTVFSEPALITLPLSGDAVSNKSRIGAFVYDAKGRWVRVPVVDVDTEKGVVFAKAKHFSLYAAAETKLGLDVSAKLAPSTGVCAGMLFVDAWIEEPATQVDASQIGNLPAQLAALAEGKNLADLLVLDGVHGSLRVVRVVELAQGSGDQRVVIESRLLVTTLYLPGDGTASLKHTDALGRELGTSSFGSLRDSLATIWTHLSGRAVRAVFAMTPASGISVSARAHALYFEGDASLDPVSADDLGFAMVDTDAVAISAPMSDGRDTDLDCDGLIKAYDGTDDRLMPRIVLKPEGVSSGVVNSPVRLTASLVHGSDKDLLAWQVLSGDASLNTVDGVPDARDFVAKEPGRFLVEVTTKIDGQGLSSVFAIDVSPEAALPSCTPSPAASTLKQGESIGISAVLSDTSLGASTLEVAWGTMLDGAFVSSAEIASLGYEARLTPIYASRYTVACRALQGMRKGAIGTASIDVVSPQQNLPPTDLTLSPSYETLLVGAPLSLSVSARDPEGTDLRFIWSSDGGSLGTPVSQGQKSKVSFSADKPGLYEVRVAIRDQADLPQEIRARVLVVSQTADTEGVDADRDGWPAKLDCDDNNAKVHPGAADRCGDAIDDDCSGAPKRDDCDDDGVTAEAGDCNDANREIRPGTAERCDGIDNNCDGKRDEGFAIGGACSAGSGACERSAQWVCSADGFGAVCPAVPQKPTPEVCDGVDNDCDGARDEDYQPRSVQCGLGVCQSSGMTACVAGKEQSSCVPKQGAASDLTCDGRDDDCNGQVDEDVVRLVEVCNGRDDDCDGMSDENLQCGAVSTATCTPRGAETCNGEDDDCNGRFDENNVCGLSSDVNSVLGVYFGCANAACTGLNNDGFMFLANGAAIKLDTFDRAAYDPGHGPYCVDAPFTYQLNGDQISVAWQDDKGGQQGASGRFVLAGAHLTLTWTSGPADMLGVNELVRVPEQAGGLCPRGPVCQPTEVCGNGFDDNCNSLVDAADPSCAAACGAIRAPEVCDGVDNDCNGMVDDLNQPCQRSDVFGACQMGHLVCSAGAQATCQAGAPDPAGELCSDGVDNDCDNAVDESGCVALSPGETCFNAINATAGGVFTVAKGTRNDFAGMCQPQNYVDRMFYINTPTGPNAGYSIYLDAPPSLDAGGALYRMPAGYAPGGACPQVAPSEGMCLSFKRGTQPPQPYLEAGSVYMLVVEAAPDSVSPGGAFTLSLGRNNEGSCTPADGDADGVTICGGDCNDARQDTNPHASELCNQHDDDCDGMIDEQDGNCATGLPGACAVGVSECGQAQTPICRPVQTAKADYCGDNVDNDCNGAVDDNCVAAAGEACDNAIELGNGGPVTGTLVGAADDAVSRCGGAGPERFYRFTVPSGGARVRLRQSSYPGVLRYSLYGDCGLVPLQCSFMDAELPAGTYRLAVEADAANMAAPYSFTLSMEVGTICLTPDVDGDGQLACLGDCDETLASVNANVAEPATCDGIDNNCDGSVDNVRVPCAVAGLQGVCADGELRCGPQGTSTCVQTRFPDPQGRDICGDGLDNDCDGALDAQDPQSCVAVLPGDTCGLAYQVDVSAGGTFSHTLAGYADDGQFGCEYGPTGSTERFYALTLNQARVVRFEVRAPYIPGGGETSYLGVLQLDGCVATTAMRCSGSSFQGELPAGTHTFAVFGSAGRSYDLLVSTQAPGDTAGSTCLPGDTDQDGFTLCNGDCREGDATVRPGAQEVCDGRDNNCDSMVDEAMAPQPCAVAGALGECAFGDSVCTQGAMVCQGKLTPGQNPEVCSDGRDNDCDGMGDDLGTPGVDCVSLSGDACQDALPIGSSGVFNGTLTGATHKGNGCYGGTQGLAEDRYYRFDVPQPGIYYVQVMPMGPGPFPEFSSGIFYGACGMNMPNYGCVGPRDYRVVPHMVNTAGPQYLMVESDDPVNYRISIATLINAGTACSLPDGDSDGRTLCDYDCDDSNASVHPGATETFNGRDDNCDGIVDEGF